MKGIDEAERRLRVAKRLFEETKSPRTWASLSVSDRRPWIDKACDARHTNEEN